MGVTDTINLVLNTSRKLFEKIDFDDGSDRHHFIE